MPPVKSFGERIADALVEDGLLSARQIEELVEQQKQGGTRLLKLILEKAYVSEQDMAVCMGRVLNTPPINLARVTISLELADLLPREVLQNHKVVPVSRLDNKLFLAMADPLNVLALDDSNSSEFAPECSNAVISLMEEQQHVTDMGGTMRLGAYPCRLARGSRAAEIYGQPEVSERHRHRYEVSNKYRDLFVENGMRRSAVSDE